MHSTKPNSFLLFAFFMFCSLYSYEQNNTLHFDGANDRVYVGNSPLFNTAHLTVQAWVKIDYIGGWCWRCLVTKRNCCDGETEQWTMQTTCGGYVQFWGRTDNVGFGVQDPNPLLLTHG